MLEQGESRKCACGELYVYRGKSVDPLDGLSEWRQEHEVCRLGDRLRHIYTELDVIDMIEERFEAAGGIVHDCGCMESDKGGFWVLCDEHSLGGH